MTFKVITSDTKHFVDALDEHNSIIVFDLLGYDRKSLAVRMSRSPEAGGYVIEVTSDQGYRPGVNIIRKTKFADMIKIGKPKSNEPVVVARVNVQSDCKVTAEAEYTEGALVVLVQQIVPEEETVQHIAINCKEDQPEHKSDLDKIEERYRQLTKKYEKLVGKDSDHYSPWKYTEQYWLNDKPVDKKEFEKVVSTDSIEKLNSKLNKLNKSSISDNLDEMFSVFSDVFKK